MTTLALFTLKDVLEKARNGNYAVGQFDVFNIPMLQGVLRAAEKTKSPVILAYAKLFDEQTDTRHYVSLIMSMIKETSVPVVLHWDHAIDLAEIDLALENGFTGVMLDASHLPLEENIALTKEVVRRAKKYGCSVESELGHVGFENVYDLENYKYTDPEKAKYFVDETGIDALAIAIGNAHGVYTSEPKINFEILENIKSKVDIPLVLHGSSGIPDEDIRKCSRLGITKFNIYTDLCLAARSALNEGLAQGKNYFELAEVQSSAVENVAAAKMELFGCTGKA